MDLYSKLSTNLQEISNMFSTKMDDFNADLKRVAATEVVSHKELESLSCEFLIFKSLIWKSVSLLKSQMELLLLGLDRHEMMSRRKVLLFHGVEEIKQPDMDKYIIDLLQQKLKLSSITLEDLSTVHRLGSDTSKPRPILVRFSNYKHRRQAWNAKTLLKNTNVTITEFLTKPRHDLFMAARKHFGMKHCWSSEGRIVISLSGNRRHQIETMSELRALMGEFPASQSSQGQHDNTVAKGNDKAPSSAPTRASRAESKSSRRAVK